MPIIVKPAHPRPSERSFGLLFAVVFAALGVYRVFWGAGDFVYGWFAASVVVGFLALFLPRLLAPFNTLWLLLGELLGRVVSPLVLGVIFFGLLTPIAVITRLFGRDELRLRRHSVSSYWVDRTPPGPVAESFNNQF
jgi:hypothetical protein